MTKLENFLFGVFLGFVLVFWLLFFFLRITFEFLNSIVCCEYQISLRDFWEMFWDPWGAFSKAIALNANELFTRNYATGSSSKAIIISIIMHAWTHKKFVILPHHNVVMVMHLILQFLIFEAECTNCAKVSVLACVGVWLPHKQTCKKSAFLQWI